MEPNQLPPGFVDCPARPEDLPELVEMWNADARRLVGVEKFTAEAYAAEWSTPGFNLAEDTRLVRAPDGRVVGYYDVWDLHEPHVQVQCWGRVHPEYRGLGLGSYLLSWAEWRAARAVEKAPPGAQVCLYSFVARINTDASDLFLGSGFQAVRYSLRMVIDLDAPPPAPAWPEGVGVRTLRVGQDEPAMVAAVRGSFQDHWGYVERPFEEDLQRWQHHMRSDPYFDPALYFLAYDRTLPPGEDLAGICLCDLKVSDDPEMGWVGSLGVLRPWRKRGLGLALLLHAFGEFFRRGKPRAGLGVDAGSLTGATRLYERAGMRPDPQREYVSYEKILRPGHDLRTLEVA